MNWPAVGLLGVVALLMLPGSKKLEKGKVYVATFQAPEGLRVDQSVLDHLTSILPPDTVGRLKDGLMVFTFTAVNDQEMTDLPTPLGTFKLISVKPV